MINSIKVSGYRGFEQFAMNGLGRVNLLVGKNNSGKTSLLEALLLLTFKSDPSVLWRVLGHRGEQLIAENVPGRAVQPELDISHLFHGHEIKPGAEFTITTQNQKPVRLLRGHIETTKPQDSPVLFAQLGQAINDASAGGRLAIKFDGTPGANIPPIPLTNETGIRQDLFGHLANMTRVSKRTEVGTPQYISTESLNVSELLSLWNTIILTPEEDRATKALHFLEPAIERIAPVNTGPMVYQFGLPARGGFGVRLKGNDHRIPIGSFGDGIWRVLALAVAIGRATNNLLLIDEIDTGLHYSVMTDMWKLIYNAAELFKVQVFATTHSYDCVHSLATICNSVDDGHNQITIHRIESGKTESIRFTEQQIKSAAERDIEIR